MNTESTNQADADLIAEARDFATAWLENESNGDHIYELIRMEGEEGERHEHSYKVTVTLLRDLADALEKAEQARANAEAVIESIRAEQRDYTIPHDEALSNIGTILTANDNEKGNNHEPEK